MDIDKPIKSLVPSNMTSDLMSKTLFQIINDYVNGTSVEEAEAKYNISSAVGSALNYTKFQVMVSCYGGVSIESSVSHVLQTVVRQFHLTMEFKTERLQVLNKTGLVSLMENDTNTDTLRFCSNLMKTLKDNYGTILEKESMSRINNNNGTLYQMAFQELGISKDHLMEFLIAKYMNDEAKVKKLSMMFHDSVLSTFAGKGNLTTDDELKNVIETDFSLPADFFEVEIKEMFDLPQFVVVALGQSHINRLHGYSNVNTTIKDLILASQQVKTKLDFIFNLPLAVAASLVDIQWTSLEDIKKIKLQTIPNEYLGFGDTVLDFMSTRYLEEKFNIKSGIAFLILPKQTLSTVVDFNRLPLLQALSTTLMDVYSSYNLTKFPPDDVTGKLARDTASSYERFLPQVK